MSAPRRYGDYVLLESLGRGGMSAVDLARRSVDGANYVRFLVIKRILRKNHHDPTFLRMFVDEARINAELQHENIAQVYDFGEMGGEWYLAMEYVPGVDLRQIQRVVAKKEPGTLIPPRIALRILHDVLSALQYAHERVDTYGRPMRIVHRDVNPRNIMVSIRGEVKLIDFGVAKADTRHDHTTGQAIKGKFAYMAPEQIESDQPVDGRADLFAMGLLLQELLTGTHPFRHLNEVQIIHRLMADRIDPMPDPPPPLDAAAVRDVRNRALSSSPAARHADARELQADLLRLAAPLGGLASRAELAGFFQRADPETAGRIAQRLQHWKDSPPPPHTLAPEPTADSDSLGLPDDTWASDARTHEVAREWSEGSGTLSDSQPSSSTFSQELAEPGTVADPLPVAAPTPSPEPDAPPEQPVGGLSVASALGIGGAIGLLFVGLLGLVILGIRGFADTELHPTPSVQPTEVAPPPVESGPDEAAAPEPVDPPPEASAPARPTSTRPAPPKNTKPTAAKKAAPQKTSTPAEPPPPEASAGTEPPPPAEVEAPVETKEESPPTPAETGFLFATSRPRGLEVWIAGRKLGVTPLANVPIPVGTHTVIFRDPVAGTTREQAVTILANQPAQASVSVK